MRTIQLYGRLPDAQMEALEGTLIDEDAFDILVDGPEDTTVMLPTMEPLFVVRRQVVPRGMVQAMLPSYVLSLQCGNSPERPLKKVDFSNIIIYTRLCKVNKFTG